MANQNSAARIILAISVLLIVVFGAAYFMANGADTRSDGQRIGDAIDGVGSKGVGEAVDRLGDQSPAERVGNAVEDSK